MVQHKSARANGAKDLHRFSDTAEGILMNLRFICGKNRHVRERAEPMVHKFFVAFIPIFVAIDAIGLVAVFMGLAGDTPREQRQREGFIAIFTALCISVGFIFLGRIIFTALGITVADFQVAGGLILLGLAGRELLNVAPASREATDDFGVVPLGMPLIAGPALLTFFLVLADTIEIYTLSLPVARLACRH